MEAAMKTVLFACLCAISTAALSTELQIFEQRLTLHPDCTLEIKRPDGSQEKKSVPASSGYGGCTIINLSDTNIPRLERMPMGIYIFLVEARKGLMETCRSESWGVVVARTGEIKVESKANRSGSCGADPDHKVFEILYNELYNRKVR